MGMGAAIVGGAVVGAAGSAVAGSKAASAQKSAANSAADAQVQAAQLSADVQREMYNTSRGDQQPWMKTGKNALYELADLYGILRPGTNWNNYNQVKADAMKRFQTSPGYQFQLSEGTKALDRSAAARGKLLGGAQMKAITKFGQGVASEEFGNYTNRLAALAGVGQASATQTGQAAMQTGQGIGNTLMQSGAARASAYQTAGNAQAANYANMASSLNSGVNNSLYLYGAKEGWFK